MSAREDFWESGLPFISDAENKRVDWTDVGLLGVGTILTSFFDSLADLVAALWETIVIARVEDVTEFVTTAIERPIVQVLAGLDASTAVEFASETGFAGSILIIAAGGYLLAWIIGVIRE